MIEDLAFLDPEQLLLNISNGQDPSAEEITQILDILEAVVEDSPGRKPSLDDVYSYLIILGKLKLKEHSHLVERCLELGDPLTAALILQILCVDWEMAEEYLERVISFALGVAWDVDQDVQQTALSIMGEYLADSLSDEAKGLKPELSLTPYQCRVLDLLLNVFEDEYAEAWTRKSAYYALGRAYGMPHEKLPAECAVLDFRADSNDIDRKMLGELSALLEKSKQEPGRLVGNDESLGFPPRASS